MGFFDVHCHILPGVDDGAANLEESVLLLQTARDQGITVIIATPHCIPGEGIGASPSEIRRLCSELNSVAESKGIGVSVLPGSEAMITPGLPDELASGNVVSLGDKNTACLLELPMAEYPSYVDDVIFRIQLAGITPVLAHPERNLFLCANPSLVYELISRGALIQMNAGSLAGIYGNRVRKTAELFLRNRWVHLLGSDGHNPRHRPILFRNAVERIRRVVGDEGANRILVQNPKLLLAGREVRQETVSPGGLSSIFRRVLKKPRKSRRSL